MVSSQRYHETSDATLLAKQYAIPWRPTTYSYDFENFHHPLIGRLLRKLNQSSAADPVRDVLDPTFLAGLADAQPPNANPAYFTAQYTVGANKVVAHPRQIDLDPQLPYANYNWELLYHIPVAVGIHLTQTQRFAEAQKWFHYVFDPTSTDTSVPAPARFWKFLYFRDNAVPADLDALLTLLATPDAELTSTQIAQKNTIKTGYENSVKHPFVPYAVARSRPVAFQYAVVMAYLDNLIAWGDSLFSQMTQETVNEATLCYVLAANLLGPRPQTIPQVGRRSAKSFKDLKAALDPMSNALVALEGQFPFNLTPTGTPPAAPDGTDVLFGIARSLYFCIPPNSKLLGYWDIVDDRLTKIRNCENISGQVQLMPLFDPPIDPGMLVAATAAGMDLASAISGLNQPISPIRAPLLIQKASELAAEVRALGSALLAAIEKGDAEVLAQLRQTNEITLGTMTADLRYVQWQQAQASTEALLRTRVSALERYTYYLRLFGQTPDANAAPATFTVDHSAETLTADNFADYYARLVGTYDQTIRQMAYPRLQLADGGSAATQSGAAGGGMLFLNDNEDAELNIHMPLARDSRMGATAMDAVATAVSFVPDMSVDLHYWGIGIHSEIFGGGKSLSAIAKIGGDVLRILGEYESDQGAMAGRKASYQRRADEWMLQANLAAHELAQLGRQIIVSIIAEQVAAKEYATAQTQLQQSRDVLTFLQTKFTNADLYAWMQGQLSTAYHQYYSLALDTARKAEATMKWELMRPELDAIGYIQPNYWDGGHRGLLTGEKLGFDLHRMELDYQTYNLRELELTKHVSLRQLDPVALLTLKATGTCAVSIPEWVYDRDCPGHYLRRIKTVSVSVPSVVGPYTSVNCSLELQSSSVRTSSIVGTSYPRRSDGDDARFVDYYGTVQTVVTSGAVADSGMFETNLRDERFLPFEGAGAISTWNVGLPPMPSFDYGTITDVILHIRYTARDGGRALASGALGTLKPKLPPSAPAPQAQLPLLLNLRHDFPTQWYAFSTGSGDFTATFTMDYLTYAVQHATITYADNMTVYTSSTGSIASTTVPSGVAPGGVAGSWTLTVPAAALDRATTGDVYVLLAYTAAHPTVVGA
jgi:hypothetical protein